MIERGERDLGRAVAEIENALKRAADPGRAGNEKRYLKSKLEHLGVSVPLIRKTAREWLHRHPETRRQDFLPVVCALWADPVHEYRVCAAELLRQRTDRLEAADLQLVEGLLRQSGTWALVDNLALHVAGPLLVRFPELCRFLDRWATDDDFWIRRAALLALLMPLRRGEGQFDRFSRYADAMLEEEEFFIRKAIGWVLREVSRKDPESVFHWLSPRVTRASALTLREASKYLPEEQRNLLYEIRAAG